MARAEATTNTRVRGLVIVRAALEMTESVARSSSVGMGDSAMAPRQRVDNLPAPPWLDRAHRELRRLRDDGSGWGGAPAEPPNEVAMVSAQEVLDALHGAGLEPSRIIASGEGGVAFCFVSGDRYADIEYFNSGEILAMTKVLRGGGTPRIWPVAGDDDLREAIDTISQFVR